jgi:hypothetical protein
MKKYSIGLAAIVFAIAFSAFTKAPNFVNYKFELKPGVDLTSEAAVELKTNWQESALTCSGSQVPCTIEVAEAFTHMDGQLRVLNTTVQQGSVVIIESENGFLDTAPNPDVQYKRIATGTNYTFANQAIE